MNISARVTVGDIREFVYRDTGPRGPARTSRRAAAVLGFTGLWMLFAMAAFGVALAVFLWRHGPETLLSRPVLLGLVLLGLAIVPIAILWLRFAGRLRGTLTAQAAAGYIDESGLRDGLNIGATTFGLDADHLTVTLSEVQDTYPWSAFQRLVETHGTFCLMIDAGSAIVVPKRACGPEMPPEALAAFVTERIAAA